MDKGNGEMKGHTMVAFFMSLLELMGQVESADALYRNYVMFCLARDVEPETIGVFTDSFRGLLSRIEGEIL